LLGLTISFYPFYFFFNLFFVLPIFLLFFTYLLQDFFNLVDIYLWFLGRSLARY